VVFRLQGRTNSPEFCTELLHTFLPYISGLRCDCQLSED